MNSTATPSAGPLNSACIRRRGVSIICEVMPGSVEMLLIVDVLLCVLRTVSSMAFIVQKRRDLRNDTPRASVVQHRHVVAGHFDKAAVCQPRDSLLRLRGR